MELPRICLSFEMDTMLKLKFSDANCIALGFLCYLHAPGTKEPTLRILLSLLVNEAPSHPWPLEVDRVTPLKPGHLS